MIRNVSQMDAMEVRLELPGTGLKRQELSQEAIKEIIHFVSHKLWKNVLTTLTLLHCLIVLMLKQLNLNVLRNVLEIHQ